MVEDKKNTTKKKTLSLKLGSSIKPNPAKSFEIGSTVIVERKRARKNIFSSSENDSQEKQTTEKLVPQIIGEHPMVAKHDCRRFAIYLIFSFISFNSLYICLKPSNKTVTALV